MNAEHILLAIVIALSSWTLHSVVKLREQLAALPCRYCPPARSPALPLAAALSLLFTVHLSADPATNAVIDQAGPVLIVTDQADAAQSETSISGDASSGFITTIVGGIPWQTVFDWFAGVALPALFALWRKHAKNSKVLLSVINAVETSSVSRIVKTEIDTAARQANVQPRLDKIVQSQT